MRACEGKEEKKGKTLYAKMSDEHVDKQERKCVLRLQETELGVSGRNRGEEKKTAGNSEGSL